MAKYIRDTLPPRRWKQYSLTGGVVFDEAPKAMRMLSAGYIVVIDDCGTEWRISVTENETLSLSPAAIKAVGIKATDSTVTAIIALW